MSEDKQDQEVPRRVECRAAKDPAVRLFIFAAMLIGIGFWFFLDAYVWKKYPAEGIENINDAFTYYLNHIGGIAFPILGLIPLVWGMIFLRRRLIADEEGIGYAGGQKIPWSEIRALDSSKLASKGILYLKYDSGGKQGTLKLDSWKLQGFRELVALVESKAVAEGG